MKPSEPVQVEPLLDPNEPKGPVRRRYYLLKEMHSPPIAPSNAVRWRAYPWPRAVRQGGLPVKGVAYGFIEYEDKVSWADLKIYGMYPFDHAESLLFDLWLALGEDKVRLADFFEQFFKVIEDDPDLTRIESALGLIYWGWIPDQIRTAIEAIEG